MFARTKGNARAPLLMVADCKVPRPGLLTERYDGPRCAATATMEWCSSLRSDALSGFFPDRPIRSRADRIQSDHERAARPNAAGRSP